MTKKIYVGAFVFLPLEIFQFEKCTRFPIFSNKSVLGAYIRTNTYFGKYLEQRKELTRFAWVKTTAKILDWCNIWPFIMIFMGYTYHMVHLFQRLLYKE